MEIELIAGRYRIIRAIGRGGMGALWLCRDEVLGRDVAVKQIGTLLGDDADVFERARREARHAASLNHPNAVGIHDVIAHDGKPWLVMEYVPARNLLQVIAERERLTPQEVAQIAAQVGSALAAAHLRGIVHRDVKPSNVLVSDDGAAKITDFGIARGDLDPQLTRTGLVSGTPAYFAPEVARGGSATAASDVWALGALIYHGVEGVPPYRLDENTNGMLYRIATELPARPRFAGALAPLMGRLLAADPTQRPTMNEAADALAMFAAGGDDGTQVPGSDVGPVAAGVPVAWLDQAAPGEPHAMPAGQDRPPPVAPAGHGPPLADPHVGGWNPVPEVLSAKRRGPLIAAAAAVLALAVAVGIVLVVKNGNDRTQAAGSSTSPTSAAGSAASTSESPATTDETSTRAPEPSMTPAPEAQEADTQQPETQAPEAPSPTTEQPAASVAPTAGNGAADLALPASGTWILILQSMPQDEKSLAEAQALASQLAVPGYDVVVVDSSSTPGLNSGYWAVSVVSFSSQDAASAACAAFSRAVGPACYPRLIE